MKKGIRVFVTVLLVACCLWSLTISVGAAAAPNGVLSAATPEVAKALKAPQAPDISGKYRTSAARIIDKVSPVSVAVSMENNELVIDPVTNTVGNLYDSDGNLIPCTLSSDGHFIIVPTNDGYVYIPSGK